jgi:glycosyltransferase involved in cell wall biosynthesis
MQKRVLVSVTSDIVTDQRVLRTAELISKSGSEIIVIGRRLPVSPGCEMLPFRCIRYSMLFTRGFLFYKFFNIRLLFTLLSHRADLLVANDLDTLLPNYIVSVIKKVPLVYDAHEYFTGTPGLESRPFVRRVWKFIERKTIPGLKHMITVNDSIASLYSKEYGIEPIVMHNYSRRFTGVAASREELGIPGEDLLCVLQGTGINRGRGGKEAIEALLLAEGVHLLVIGRGDTLKEMRDLVLELNLADRVTFLPVMMWEDMMSYTAMCDAGLSLDDSSSTNSRFSLPNKIFDYMEAGLAIIATDLPEVSAVIKTAGCGIVIAGNSAVEIAYAMGQLRDNKSLLMELRDKSVAGRSRWSRESEEEKVKELYRLAQLTF